jgi:hypothetical protein
VLGLGGLTPPPLPPVAGDKKMDRTFLKLAALSLSPSTSPVLHGCDDKSNGYEISDEKKFKQRRR